jgi:hypothetical protein
MSNADQTGQLVRAAEAARRRAGHLRTQRDHRAREAELNAADLAFLAAAGVRLDLMTLERNLEQLAPDEVRAALRRAYEHLEALS